MNIERLIFAIQMHEGWIAIGDPLHPNGSVSYTHHNFGNLRASPFAIRIYNGYAVFRNDFVGRFALWFDIFEKAQGKGQSTLNGNSTIAEMIKVYAPPSDNNDDEAYLTSIENISGLKRTDTLASLFV